MRMLLRACLVSVAMGCASGDTGAADVVLLDEADAAADLKADPGGLSPSDEADVLRAVDAACAASWCRGSYAYRFTRLACDFGAERCTLVGVALPSARDGSFSRACRIRGLDSVDALAERTGADATLKPPFTDKVGRCVAKWAATLN